MKTSREKEPPASVWVLSLKGNRQKQTGAPGSHPAGCKTQKQSDHRFYWRRAFDGSFTLEAQAIPPAPSPCTCRRHEPLLEPTCSSFQPLKCICFSEQILLHTAKRKSQWVSLSTSPSPRVCKRGPGGPPQRVRQPRSMTSPTVGQPCATVPSGALSFPRSPFFLPAWLGYTSTYH